MDNFRKIDIDQYDEDVLQDSELYIADSRDPHEVLDEAKQRQAAVRSSLARCVVVMAQNAEYNADSIYHGRVTSHHF